MRNLYEILGIEKNATEQEIKKAYNKLLRKYPPEKEPEKYKEIREAYDTLRDKERRKNYDAYFEHGDEIKKLEKEANELIEQKNYNRAETILKKILTISPEIIHIRELLGDIFLLEEKYDESIKQFNTLINEYNNNSDYYFKRGKAYTEKEDYYEAEKDYLKAYELDYENLGAINELVHLYIIQQQIDKAIDFLNKEIYRDNSLDFEDFFSLSKLIECYVFKNDKSGLQKVIADIKKIAPEDEDTRKYMSWKLAKLAANISTINLYTLAYEVADLASSLYKDDNIKEILKTIKLYKLTDELIDDKNIPYAPLTGPLVYYMYREKVSEEDIEKNREVILYDMTSLVSKVLDNMKETLSILKTKYKELYLEQKELYEKLEKELDRQILLAKEFKLFIEDTRIDEAFRQCVAALGINDKALLEKGIKKLNRSRKDNLKKSMYLLYKYPAIKEQYYKLILEIGKMINYTVEEAERDYREEQNREKVRQEEERRRKINEERRKREEEKKKAEDFKKWQEKEKIRQEKERKAKEEERIRLAKEREEKRRKKEARIKEIKETIKTVREKLEIFLKKHKYVPFFIVFLFFICIGLYRYNFGPHETTYKNGDVENYEYSFGKKKGSATYNYINGDIENYTYVDGIKEGPATYNYTNGDIENYTYVDGVKEGPATYNYANGDIENYTYVDGVKEGFVVLKDDFDTETKYTYKNGVIDGLYTISSYDFEEKYTYKNGVKEGPAEFFNYLGGELEKCIYKNNVKNGIAEIYRFRAKNYDTAEDTIKYIGSINSERPKKEYIYEKGKVKNSATYYFGNEIVEEIISEKSSKENTVIHIFANGDREKYICKNGHKEGPATYYYTNGNKEEYSYKGNLEDKLDISLQTNFIPKTWNEEYTSDSIEKVIYVNDIKEGPAVLYFSSNLQKNDIFKDGIKEGPATYYYANGDKEEYKYVIFKETINGKEVEKYKKEGPATYYYANGDREEYKYVDGEKRGVVVSYYKKGNETIHQYRDDIKSEDLYNKRNDDNLEENTYKNESTNDNTDTSQDINSKIISSNIQSNNNEIEEQTNKNESINGNIDIYQYINSKVTSSNAQSDNNGTEEQTNKNESENSNVDIYQYINTKTISSDTQNNNEIEEQTNKNESENESIKKEEVEKKNGTFTYWINGNKEECQVKNGIKDGEAICFYSNGDREESVYVNGKKEGSASYYYINGDIKEYTYKNGKINGKGVYYYKNGDKEEYQYINGVKEGKAVYYFRNKDKLFFSYKNGIEDGEAILQTSRGKIKKYKYINGVITE